MSTLLKILKRKERVLAAEMSEERERDMSAEKKPREERENKREKYMDNVFVICIKCDI